MLYIKGICRTWFGAEWSIFGMVLIAVSLIVCWLTASCDKTSSYMKIVHWISIYPVLWVISWTSHACRCVFWYYQTLSILNDWSAERSLYTYLHTILRLGRMLCSKNLVSHCCVCHFCCVKILPLEIWSNHFSWKQLAHTQLHLRSCWGNMNDFWTNLWHIQVFASRIVCYRRIAWSIFTGFDS